MIIILQAWAMNDDSYDRKYSKISPALKAYFLNNLYLRSMTIKEVIMSWR